MMARVFIWAALLYVLVQQARSQCGAGSTNCKCIWKSYTLDISNAFAYPYPAISSDGKYDYYYSPCETISCAASATQTNVCQKSATTPSVNQYDCGINPAWTVTNATYFTVKYTASSGTPIRSTTVTFIQDGTSPSTSTPVVESPASSGRYSFTVRFRSTGGSSSGTGDASGYVGFILISLTFAALVAYFVAGSIIMYTFKGARGIEVIPNIGFWKDLPFLIKDGILFMLNPCCGQRLQKYSYTKM